MTILLLVAGLTALVAGAEMLVRGASRLATAAGISPLVIGLTVVAFGTSAPEMAVSIAASLNGQADVAVGNVVGSNTFNVLFILGISALIVPLVVAQNLLRFDVPVMIGVSLLVPLCGRDGRIDRLEGSAMAAGLVAYTIWCVVVGRREAAAVQLEYAREFANGPAATNDATPAGRTARLMLQTILVAAGLGLLILGSRWFVSGAVELARGLGIGELMIGLTIVAAGTSLPEVATSIVAAIRGERDIAVGNVVGSNVFNVLGVLGLTAAASPNGTVVASAAMDFDVPVMIAASAACLPVFFTGHRIARWEGALFLGCYAAYVAALAQAAMNADGLPPQRWWMIGLVIPLTLLTLTIIAVRECRAHAVDRDR